MIEPTKGDIGRAVVYRDSSGTTETGTVVSFTEEWVYVRYRVWPEATARADLSWALPAEAPYVCPDCGRRSYHPQDKLHRFCVVCGFEDVNDLRRQLSRGSSSR